MLACLPHTGSLHTESPGCIHVLSHHSRGKSLALVSLTERGLPRAPPGSVSPCHAVGDVCECGRSMALSASPMGQPEPSQPRAAISPWAGSREGLPPPGDNKNLLASVGVTLRVCHGGLRGQSSASAVLGKDLDREVSVCAGCQREAHSLCRTGWGVCGTPCVSSGWGRGSGVEPVLERAVCVTLEPQPGVQPLTAPLSPQVPPVSLCPFPLSSAPAWPVGTALHSGQPSSTTSPSSSSSSLAGQPHRYPTWPSSPSW